MTHTPYSEGFKARQIKRMAGPEGISAGALAADTGVSQATLSRWLRDAHSVQGMEPKKSKNSPAKKSWTVAEKIRILGEASQLDDKALGGFLREEGLHEATLRQWEKALSQATSPKRSKKSPEAKKITQLERELRRKEKALAEMAALITLQKKVREIWGGEDDDMDTKSGT